VLYPLQRPDYSTRKARDGATRVARRAGIKLAATETPISKAVTAANVAGSLDVTPHNCPSSQRVRARDPRNPKSRPTPTGQNARTPTSPTMSLGFPPTALRIRNSFTRCETDELITPYTPTAAKTIARN